MAALTFLTMEGYQCDPDPAIQDRLYDAMIAIAKHELNKVGFAALFREIFH